MQAMTSKLITALFILNVILLSSCGFTLRGSATLAPELQELYLESSDGNSDILREMRRVLIASDINLLDQAEADRYRLGLGNERSVERVLSVNSNARAGEYELTLSVPVQLRIGDNLVFGPETLTIEKVYLADPNSAVAKAEERELMESEMRRELVNQILRRLQSLELEDS